MIRITDLSEIRKHLEIDTPREGCFGVTYEEAIEGMLELIRSGKLEASVDRRGEICFRATESEVGK